MLKKILFSFIFIIVGMVVFVSMQPSALQVSRSIAIACSPEVAFSQVNNQHRWQAWSPWEKIDPTMTRSFVGPEEGVGATYVWDGNMEVGTGRSTIVESRPNEVVKFKLEILKPFASTNDVEFNFTPDGSNTVVTWTMVGEKNFIMKAVGLFLSCDEVIGGQFTTGLAQLKSVIENNK